MSIKLAILGLLMEGDSHPYEIRQIMKERSMDKFFKIQEGSLYYAMDQLGKDEFVEAIEVVREGNRPDKTIYRITDSGKASFHHLLLDQLDRKNGFFHPMYAALAFSGYGDDQKIAVVLEKKIRECELQLKEAKATYEEHIPLVPRGVLHLMWGRYEHLKVELAWLIRLHQDAAASRLKEVGISLEWDQA